MRESFLNKPRIKLFDSVFSENGVAIGSRKPPTYFDWYKGNEYCDVAVFTGTSLSEAARCDSKVKIALLLEPPEIAEHIYRDADKWAGAGVFDLILTHQKWFVDLHPEKARLYQLGGCWIEQPRIYEKTKNISMIFSWKKETQGQRMRHQIYNFLCSSKLKNGVDFFGRGHKEIAAIEEKLDGLKDYRFSIAVENSSTPCYFTEKIIDCFATGTIPIYYGCPYISDYFNSDGIFYFETIETLGRIINLLTEHGEEEYEQRLGAVVDNYWSAQGKLITCDWLWWNYFSGYFMGKILHDTGA